MKRYICLKLNKFILLMLMCSACSSQSIGTLSSISSPAPANIPQQVETTSIAVEECRQHFIEVTNLTNVAYLPENWETLDLVKTWYEIISQLIKAGEIFLNDCSDSDLALLAKQAKVVPSSFHCGVPSSFYHYTPTTQLIDVNFDGVNEIILHTQIARCYATSGLEGSGTGGVSIIFFQNPQSKKWEGQIIWPIPSDSLLRTLQRHPEPTVQMLNIRDTQNRTYMAISRVYQSSGTYAGNELAVLRWEDSQHNIVLEDYLSFNCGQPTEYEFSEEGYILIPFAEEVNSRCGQREAKVYVLENDEFVAKTP